MTGKTPAEAQIVLGTHETSHPAPMANLGFDSYFARENDQVYEGQCPACSRGGSDEVPRLRRGNSGAARGLSIARK